MGTGTTLATFLARFESYPTQTYPDFRALANGMTDVASFEVGSVTGVAASTVDVTTRGNPRAVIVINGNDGTMGVKLEDMATSTAFKLNATGPAVTIPANMITLDTNKFTIGNDAELNTAHTLHYIAIL